jgi:hypothetical protein
MFMAPWWKIQQYFQQPSPYSNTNYTEWVRNISIVDIYIL